MVLSLLTTGANDTGFKLTTQHSWHWWQDDHYFVFDNNGKFTAITIKTSEKMWPPVSLTTIVGRGKMIHEKDIKSKSWRHSPFTNKILLIENDKKSKRASFRTEHTVNVDCVKFEYVVLAKYHHMLIFEFDLLTKQHILILCKKLL